MAAKILLSSIRRNEKTTLIACQMDDMSQGKKKKHLKKK